MNTSASIAIDLCVLICAPIGFLTSIAMLALIFYSRQRYPVTVPILLVCNTYLCIIFISIIIVDMYAHNLFGDLHANVSFDDEWCQVRAYLLHSGLGLLYHSYLLQAMFRFFRVVLFRHKRLQTFRFTFLLVCIQGFMNFALMIPVLRLHHFQYVPHYYYCEILLSNSQGLLLIGILTYQWPLSAIGGIYCYIVYFMKKSKGQSVLQNRRSTNQRDLVVVRRIVIIIGLLFILALPTTILWMNYIATGYVNPLGYHLGWSTFTFSLSILPATLAFLTPQLREVIAAAWRNTRRVNIVAL